MNRPIRVLLVEDSENDAALMLLELRKGGYAPFSQRVQTAAAMGKALDEQSWDAVIADYVLPQFSGPAALRLLQERGLDLPFIIVSGHIDEDTAVASMKAGAHDYVMKDRLTRLVPAIERELLESEVRRARRRTETEFAREQTLRRTIEDSIPSGIAAVDAEGRHTYVNPAFCHLVGRSETELLGTLPPYIYWPPESAAAIQEEVTRFVQKRTPTEGIELRFCHSSGKLFDVLLLINPLKDAQGTVVGWLGSVTDITERKRAEQRLRIQYAVASALSQASDLKAATPEILALIGNGMGWKAGWLWRAIPGTVEMKCIGSWGDSSVIDAEFETAGREAAFQGSTGFKRASSAGEQRWTPDFGRDRRNPSSTNTDLEGLGGICSFPIRSGGATLGVLEFLISGVPEPEDSLQQWMDAIGSQIGQFMERETAVEALRRAHDELERRVRERTADLMSANLQLENAMRERKRLEHELLDITEKERRRIGLDLHDDLGQKLAGLTLMMKGLELGLARKKLPEAAEAQKIHALIEQTVQHAGALARDLTLADMGEDDLPSALKSLSSHVENLFEISCKFKSEGQIPILEGNVIMQLYKISQEAVTNAVKHGKAARVTIQLEAETDRLILTIRNNGLPFPSMINQSKGMGLRIMKYRANVIGATLEIKPGRPKGTIVECILPTRPGPISGSNGSKQARHHTPS